MAIDFEAEAAAAAQVGPADEQLKQISVLAERQLMLEAQVAEVEEHLKAKRAELEKCRTVDLPEAMASAGVQKFTTSDGFEVSVKDDLACSIPKARQAEAFAWLEENGLAAIIKRTLALQFGRGEQVECEVAADLLRAAGFSYDEKEAVAPQTLKAALKELRKEGEEIPAELFNTYFYTIAKVSR